MRKFIVGEGIRDLEKGWRQRRGRGGGGQKEKERPARNTWKQKKREGRTGLRSYPLYRLRLQLAGYVSR